MMTPLKVAIIDDDKSARTSLARLIKSAGIEVLSFSSAREFLDDSRRTQVDCAVTDVRMPGFDGFALQETLAQTLSYLSVIFISGHGDFPMTVKAIRGGAVDFLEKPVDDEAGSGSPHHWNRRSLRTFCMPFRRLSSGCPCASPGPSIYAIVGRI
jgi:FixJ family two-component response regulator